MIISLTMSRPLMNTWRPFSPRSETRCANRSRSSLSSITFDFRNLLLIEPLSLSPIGKADEDPSSRRSGLCSEVARKDGDPPSQDCLG